VAPGNVSTFLTAALVVFVAGIAGCIAPAVRASRVDPAVALRAE
jgi:ABC-type antimicrobial peptide transport system permease subunit